IVHAFADAGPARTSLYTLSLHDALPICGYYKDDGPGSSPPGNLHAVPNASPRIEQHAAANMRPYTVFGKRYVPQSGERPFRQTRSEEHTSELQSRENLVCRLLLEKKKST